MMKNAFEEALAALPERCSANNYDSMTVSLDHMERVRRAHPDTQTLCFGGVRLIASSAVPDGFAVLKNGDEVVGAIDFNSGSAWVAKPKAKNRMQLS